jgi:hypothetical protein
MTPDVLIVSTLAGIVIVRAMPMVAWLLVGRRALLPKALLCLALVLGAANHPGFFPSLLPALVTLGYFAVLAVGFHRLPEIFRKRQLGKDSLIIGSAALSLIVPAILIPPPMRLAVIVAGFEFTLKAYSYTIEVSRTPLADRPRLGESMFFLLVNPVLVYADRGHPIENGTIQGLRRALLGVGALTLYVLAITSFSRERVLQVFTWDTTSTLARAVATLGLCLSTLIAVYAVHSGVASIQIGILRALGYTIPERYRYALLARDPIDWWRRWNSYLGRWFQRYAFLPVALYIGRRKTSWPSNVAKGVAVLVAFAGSGILHELAQYCIRAELSGKIVCGFLAEGLLVILWAGGRQLTQRVLTRSTKSARSRAVNALRAAVSWSLFATCHLFVLTALFQELGGGH